MTSHRQLNTTVDGLAAVAIGTALMAGAPIGPGSAGGDASGDPAKLRAAAATRRPRPAA